MDVEKAIKLISVHDHRVAQVVHYPNSGPKQRALERSASELFKELTGRKPTDEELRRCV